jgi:hypothetical protein
MKPRQRVVGLLLALGLLSTPPPARSQFVVTDFYNGVINTISQTIQAAAKLISSDQFKQILKTAEKLKQVGQGVQSYRRVQETVAHLQTSVRYYRLAINILAQDRHFRPAELQSFSSAILSQATQDSRLISDLAQAITANKNEMNSAERLQFITLVHRDAQASAVRLRSVINALKGHSMARAVNTADKLATLRLYALVRRADQGQPALDGGEVDFGRYDEAVAPSDDQYLVRGEASATGATTTHLARLEDPNDPRARVTAVHNLQNDPPPSKPDKQKLGFFEKLNLGKQEEAEAEYQQALAVWQEMVVKWQQKHQKDFYLLGGAHVVDRIYDKPYGIEDDDWWNLILTKVKNGEPL